MSIDKNVAMQTMNIHRAGIKAIFSQFKFMCNAIYFSRIIYFLMPSTACKMALIQFAINIGNHRSQCVHLYGMLDNNSKRIE